MSRPVGSVTKAMAIPARLCCSEVRAEAMYVRSSAVSG